MKSKIKLLLVFFLVISCNSANYEKIEFNQTLKSKLDEVSFNQIDIFPSFETCNVEEDAALTKTCFINTIHKSIQDFLEQHQVEKDSFNVVLEVSKTGSLSVANIKSGTKNSTQELKTKLNLFLKQKLPKLYPAQKQGIPIRCQINLPVVIKDEI